MRTRAVNHLPRRTPMRPGRWQCLHGNERETLDLLLLLIILLVILSIAGGAFVNPFVLLLLVVVLVLFVGPYRGRRGRL